MRSRAPTNIRIRSAICAFKCRSRNFEDRACSREQIVPAVTSTFRTRRDDTARRRTGISGRCIIERDGAFHICPMHRARPHRSEIRSPLTAERISPEVFAATFLNRNISTIRAIIFALTNYNYPRVIAPNISMIHATIVATLMQRVALTCNIRLQFYSETLYGFPSDFTVFLIVQA